MNEFVAAGVFTSNYISNIRQKPVYSIVKIDPTTHYMDGSEIAYTDRCKKVVDVNEISNYDSATDDFKSKYYNMHFSMATDKAYHYVILYATNDARQKLELVFRNTTSDESDTIQIVSRRDTLEKMLADSNCSDWADDTFTVRVSTKGLTDVENGELAKLMEPSGYPAIAGFTRDATKVDIETSADGAKSVRLYYDRNKHKLSFNLKSYDDNTREYYMGKISRDDIELSFGQTYQDKLWEVVSSSRVPHIDGPNKDILERSNDIKIYVWENNKWTPYATIGDYNNLVKLLSSLDVGTYTIHLGFDWYYPHWYSTKKVPRYESDYTVTVTEEYNPSSTGNGVEYAFKRSGYVLSGFDYYYKIDDEWKYQGTTTNVLTILKMPDADVMVEPVWTRNPNQLRLEIYYQSAYDKIDATNSEKEYEFAGAKTYSVTSDGAVMNGNSPVEADGQKMTIDKLVASINDETSGGLSAYLVPYLKDYFDRREDHYLSGNFITYLVNADNTKRLGYPHYSGTDLMVVALYYDRNIMEFNFHFTNQDFYIDRNYNGDHYYTVRNQWKDFIDNSPLATYDGNATDRKALKEQLNTQTPSTEYTSIGAAQVKVINETNPPSVSNGTSITIGRVHDGRYSTTDTIPRNMSYAKTISFRGLYGAPTVFEDGTSFYPKWYYMSNDGIAPTVSFRVDGTKSGYNDYSWTSFSFMSEATKKLTMDLFPDYPVSNAGYFVLYTEKLTARNKYDDSVTIDNFDQTAEPAAKAKVSEYGSGTNTGFPLVVEGDVSGTYAFRPFIAGYQAHGYYNDTRNTSLITNITRFDEIIPDEPNKTYEAGPGYNVYVFLKRSAFTLSYIDANVATQKYLYKQKIESLPVPAVDDPANVGGNYKFDGWFTSSACLDNERVTLANGTITDEYKTGKLTDASGNLLMDCQNLQLFAKWAPKICAVTYYPFYPNYDMTTGRPYLQPEESQTMEVEYGNTISELPKFVDNISLPDTAAFANNQLVKQDNEVYYLIRDAEGSVLQRYKFEGWFKYNGLDDPTQMDSLDTRFVEGETVVTGTTRLYAKWKQEDGTAIYSISCVDYTNNGAELLRISRTGAAGANITVNPPTKNETGQPDIGTPDYTKLDGYEALSSPMNVTVSNGMLLTFYYKPENSWTLTIKNCIKDEAGNDIVISTVPVASTYNQIQVAASNITGYQIYEYQMEGDESATPKTDISGYIPVMKPDSGSAVLTVRYTLKDNAISKKADGGTYYKYDRVSLINYIAEAFDWTDNYKPAVLYTATGQKPINKYEFIGTAADEDVNKEIDNAFAELPNGSNTIALKLVAVNSATSEYTVIKDLGSININLLKSTYAVKFTDGSSEGSIYYKSKGEKNVGVWFWDATLNYPIGNNNEVIIVPKDISGLTGEVHENASKVQAIIAAADEDKVFVFVKESNGYTVVDLDRKLCNGDKLTDDWTAYVVGEIGDTYTIHLINADGTDSGKTITVVVP